VDTVVLSVNWVGFLNMLNEHFTRAIIALIRSILNVEVVEICLVSPLDIYCHLPNPSAFQKYTPQSTPLYRTTQNHELQDLKFDQVPWQFFASVPIYLQDAVVGNLWVASDTQASSKSSTVTQLQQMAGLIAERLEVEESHEIDRQRSQLLSQYIALSVDSTGLVDQDLRLLDCNDACAKLSGLPKQWMIGKNLREMGLHDSLIEKMEPWKQIMQSVFSTGQPRQDVSIFPGDVEGRFFEYTTLAIPQIDRSGKAVAVLDVSTIRNWSFPQDAEPWRTTAEKLVYEIASHRETQDKLTTLNAELEERIAKRTEELVKADRAKSIFLANASHELRTPMNGIIGMADLLCQTQLTFEQRELISTLMLCAQQMLALINNILDYSKAEAGRMEQDPEPFGVRSLVASVAAMLRESARLKGLDFAIEIDQEVPDTLIGDSVKIVQILTNLGSNAIKFTVSGKVHIQVDCLPGASSQIRFAVKDTGIGINSSDMGRLFTSFTQADASMTRRFGGTGLGLAISKQLVELMDGTICVESIPGEGSNFCFTLPLAVDETPLFAETSTTIVANHPTLQRVDAKILVVEDNAVNQMVLLRHLKQLGYTSTDVANNGLQAVAAADGKHYDLILMDCQMPEMDGFEATSIIRSRNVGKMLPIIAITALSNLDERERCQASGMNGFLQKPYTRDQLQTILQHFLELQDLHGG
jgi:signal transduction histidine kinase/CheY-like chemotaxis protein